MCRVVYLRPRKPEYRISPAASATIRFGWICAPILYGGAPSLIFPVPPNKEFKVG
jgi:hypothetical protein